MLIPIKIPAKKDKDDGKYIKIPKFSLKGMKEKITYYKRLYEDNKNEIIAVLTHVNSNLDIVYLNIAVTYGLGDAAVTGIANTAVWNAVFGVSTLLKKYLSLDKKLNTAVSPDFDKACLNANIYFCFKTNLYKFYGTYKKAAPIIEKIKSNT